MMKFVPLSLGSEESWKCLEHDRNMIRFKLSGDLAICVR